MFDAIESMEYLQQIRYCSHMSITVNKMNFVIAVCVNNYIICAFQKSLLEQNQMEIEYSLYRLYVHAMFVSNIRSFLQTNKHI